MRVEMLDVVAGKQDIHRRIRHRRHIGHGADNIGGHTLIDVEAEFLPVGAIEAACGLVFALGAAADVEESFHFDDTMRKPRLLVRDGVLKQLLSAQVLRQQLLQRSRISISGC